MTLGLLAALAAAVGYGSGSVLQASGLPGLAALLLLLALGTLVAARRVETAAVVV